MRCLLTCCSKSRSKRSCGWKSALQIPGLGVGEGRQPQAGLADVAEAGVLSSVAEGNHCSAQGCSCCLPAPGAPRAQPRLRTEDGLLFALD